MLNRIKQWPHLHLLLLLIIPVLGLWQLFFMQYTMKWDIMDQVFPWRYFISESFRNGFFPLWNPYQNLGYPIHADPQSGVWYPVVWVISFISGYTVYAINFEYLLHLLIAGLGMYKLIGSFNFNRKISVLIAIIYQGSGFFISNAQHLSWFVSAAWLPWVLYGFIKYLRYPTVRTAILFAFLLAMMLLGGYPAFALITAYILLFLIIRKLVQIFKTGDKTAVKKIILYQIVAAVAFLLMTSGYLVSFFQALPLITREETNISQVLTGHFPPKALASLLFPLATAKDGFFGSNLTLINIYISIGAFIFLFYSLINNKQWKYWGIFIGGIIALFTAFGDAFYIRELLFHYVPLMDKFRFPTIFRLFAIVSFLIIAAAGINMYFFAMDNKQNLLVGISFGTVGIIILAIILSISKKVTLFFPPVWDPKLYQERIAEATLPDLVFSQGIFQLVVILSLLIILLNKWQLHKKFLAFFALVVLDLLIAIQINVPLTVISDANPTAVQKSIDELPDGFPIPDNEPIISKSDHGRYIFPMWYNMGIFHKITAFDGYNPFVLKNSSALYNAPARDSLLTKPLLYFKGNNSATITAFGPGQLEADLNISTKDTLIFSQTYYPGWKVFIDGEEAPLFESNIALMTTVIEPEAAQIKFKYDPPLIRLLFYISIATFILLMLFLILTKNESLQHRFKNSE